MLVEAVLNGAMYWQKLLVFALCTSRECDAVKPYGVSTDISISCRIKICMKAMTQLTAVALL
jgi:hypothetical protein